MPRARDARTASSGISSMSPGISSARHLGGGERGGPDDEVGHRLAERDSSSSTRTAAPMRSEHVEEADARRD